MSRKTKDNRNLVLSDFYCTRCGLKGVPCFRTIGQEREPGHLKKLYCLHCNDDVNMIEIKPRGKYTLDDFLIEFNYGNFDENGNRKEPWSHFIKKVKNHE